MGTISEKLTYLNGTKQKLKQAINNIGGDITDNTTFRQYAEQLQNVYDILPKTDYEEGSNITLSNTLKGKLDFEDGIVGYGDTSQIQYEGYNLCEAKMPTTTATQGITFTNNGDGTYTVSGTNSSEAAVTFRINQSTQIGGDNLQNYEDGTYTLDLGIANANIQLTLMQNVSWTTYLGTGYGIRLRSQAITNVTNTFIYVAVKANASFSTPVIIKPMFVKGSYTESTIPSFEPYVGGTASPNPSYPQEIEVVRGKNLFNKATVTQRSYIDAQGVLKGADGTYCASDYIEVYRGSIVWSATTGNGYSLSIYDSSKTFIRSVGRTGNNAMVIPIANGEKYIRFTLLTADLDITQLEEGSQATPYLPYNTIEEVVSGKNLFEPVLYNNGTQIVVNNISSASVTDGEISFTASGLDMYFGNVRPAGQEYIDNRGIKIYKNGHEKISFKLSNSSLGRTYITAYNSSGISLGYTEIASAQGTYTFPDDCDFVSFRFGTGGATVGTTYKTTIMVAYGDTIPDYEPYITPTSYQLSLGDYKFYGIGTYRDYILRTTGKNLFNKDNITDNTGYTGNANDTLSTNTNTSTFIAPLITSNNGNITISSNKTSATYRVRLIDSNNKILSSTAYTTMPQTIDTRNCDKIAIMFDKTTITIADNIQIEEGSTASDYQPYGVGVWYKYGVIGEYQFTGQENWTKSGNTNNNGFLGAISDILSLALKPADNNTNANVLCNYFVSRPVNSTLNQGLIGIGLRSDGIVLMATSLSGIDDIDDFKAWLSTHNVEIIYILATPTIDIITGTLAEQLEAWWNGQTLNGTTIITSNGNLPMIIKVRGLKGE